MTGLLMAVTIGSIACGPAPKATAAYVVLSQVADTSSSTLRASIQVPANATQDAVKAAAQILIDNHKQEFKVIWVNTYVEGSSPDGPPHCASYYSGGEVSHKFRGGAEQKVPTH